MGSIPKDNSPILVVDDEAPIREVFKEFYCQAGCMVLTAENGEQALAILEHESIEVMFLDLRLSIVFFWFGILFFTLYADLNYFRLY